MGKREVELGFRRRSSVVALEVGSRECRRMWEEESEKQREKSPFLRYLTTSSNARSRPAMSTNRGMRLRRRRIGAISARIRGSAGCKNPEALLDLQDYARVEKMIRYIEDADLRRWELVGIKEFQIGIREARAKLNTLTNPHIFEQLLELDADDLISKGNSYVASRLDAANKLLAKPFKIRLGRGLYGECLAIRADGNAEFSHEIALELSSRSAAAGLRPIGAVIFMQRGNLKMCLRTTDGATDTSEIAKAFGGGGKPSSSSFIIRMDEYNEWTAINSP